MTQTDAWPETELDSQGLPKLSFRPPQQVLRAHVTDAPIKTLDA